MDILNYVLSKIWSGACAIGHGVQYVSGGAYQFVSSLTPDQFFLLVLCVSGLVTFAIGCYKGYYDALSDYAEEMSKPKHDNIELVKHLLSMARKNHYEPVRVVKEKIRYGLWDVEQYLDDYLVFLAENPPKFILLYTRDMLTDFFLKTHCFPYWNDPIHIWYDLYDYAIIYDIIRPYFLE